MYSQLSTGSSFSSPYRANEKFVELPETLDWPRKNCIGFLSVFAKKGCSEANHVYCSNRRSADPDNRCWTKTIFSKHSDGVCPACSQPIRLVRMFTSILLISYISSLQASVDIPECKRQMGPFRLPKQRCKS